MKRYVVIGASAAGLNGIDILRRVDKEAEITVISEERDIYSKCIMHYYMSGDKKKEDLCFVEKYFFEKRSVCCKLGEAALAIKREEKVVVLDSGEKVPYDKLLLATGSHAFVPDIEGSAGAKNMCAFHRLEDCEHVMKLAETAENIVILGAGLVGVDIAYGLLNRKKKITILDLKEHMMAIQLDACAASCYEEAFAEYGVEQIYHTGISKVVQDATGNIVELVLTDERKIPCDLLIIAAGTRANVTLAKECGLQTDGYGLVIDETCKTSDPDIYGAGDVTGRNMIWSVAAKEAMTAAYHMAGETYQMTDFFDGKSTIHIFKIPTLAYGLPEPPDDTYSVEIRKGSDGSYQKMIHKDGKIYGILLQKDLRYAGVLNQLISSRPDLTAVKKPLFDIDYADLLVMTGFAE